MRGYCPGRSRLNEMKRLAVCSGLALWLALACVPALATTKGLNQIVTPDIQPEGILSISAQGENSALGNSEQLQLELGVTKAFEVSLFQGFKPSATSLNAELALVHHGPYLLSTGIQSVANRVKAEPFLEGGYYQGNTELIAGIQQQDSAKVAVLGAAYQLTPKFQLMVDYMGGAQNFSTAGFTLDLDPHTHLQPGRVCQQHHPASVLWLCGADME